MKLEIIVKVLHMHSVPFYIVSNRVIADGEDITHFTPDQLDEWLGYDC